MHLSLRLVLAWTVGLLSLSLSLSSLAGVSAFIEVEEHYSTLRAIKARDTLNCGVNTSLKYFGVQPANQPGAPSVGFDPDFCTAVAAFLWGDYTVALDKVAFVGITSQNRFIELDVANVDMVSFTTTDTLGRQMIKKVDFTRPTFYDGQVSLSLSLSFSLSLSLSLFHTPHFKLTHIILLFFLFFLFFLYLRGSWC
jgi:ABC-type amino acid transport substrate-binding protein